MVESGVKQEILIEACRSPKRKNCVLVQLVVPEVIFKWIESVGKFPDGVSFSPSIYNDGVTGAVPLKCAHRDARILRFIVEEKEVWKMSG